MIVGITSASDIEGNAIEVSTGLEDLKDLLGTGHADEERSIEEIVNDGDADFLDLASFSKGDFYGRPYYGRPPSEEFRMISNQWY